MMMTGGEGCEHFDPMVPQHCPKQSDDEYRTEVSLYAILGRLPQVSSQVKCCHVVPCDVM